MKSSHRWAIAGVIAVVIGLIWLLWGRGEQKPAPAKGDVAMKPAAAKPEPKAEQAPAPKADEPVAGTVLFDYNRSEVRSSETSRLDELSAKLKARGSERVDAIGYADRIGPDAYNLQLSRRRADAVRAYLASKGIESGRIRADAKGEGDPVTGGACKDLGLENRKNQKLIECLQRDRRVEVRLAAKR